MKRSLLVLIPCVAVGAAAVAWWAAPAGAAQQAAGVPQARRDRLARMEQAVGRIQARDWAGARALLAGVAAASQFDGDVIEPTRLLALVSRREGQSHAAELDLERALAAFDNSAWAKARTPWVRGVILMDWADLRAFDLDDKKRAIELYDRVLSQPAFATPRDLRIAAQNAAMLAAGAGRPEEAARRVDELLVAPWASEVPPAEIVSLRATQATWFVQAGDLQEAYRRHKAIWDEFGHLDDLAVLRVGLRLASWNPVPDKCDVRMAMVDDLLVKIAAIRSAPAPAAPSIAELAEVEKELLIVIANSAGCANAVLVAWARQRLGLPFAP